MNEKMVRESFVDDPSPNAVRRRYAAIKKLGDCHAATGQPQAARQCYQDACELAPEQTGAYFGLGLLDLDGNRFEQAKRSFEIARRLDGRCAEAYAGLAVIHQHNRNYPAAFEMYLRCLELNSDNLLALLGLFQTSCQMGTFSKIIHYLEVYLKTNPDDAAVLFCLATLYARDGRLKAASRTLRRVLDVEPDKIEAAKLLAQVTDSLAQVEPLGAVV